MSTIQRRIVDLDTEAKAVRHVTKWLEARLEAKGPGAFASLHEILGWVEEERLELQAAVHAGRFQDCRHELTDIAVACIWGIASIDAGCDR